MVAELLAERGRDDEAAAYREAEARLRALAAAAPGTDPGGRATIPPGAHRDRRPYLDLAAPRARIEDELAARWRHALDAGAYVLGPEVAEFEAAFAAHAGAAGCVAVANGTDALVLALRALDLPPGAEVIVPGWATSSPPPRR